MKNYLALLALLILFASCEDEVEIDVPQSEPVLVVDGWLTDSLPVEVKLSTTTAYFADGTAPRISKATVRLFENEMFAAQLTEVDSLPGIYRADFTGEVGNKYHLEIEVPGNYPEKVRGTWQSIPEYMKRVPAIDSLVIRNLNRSTYPSVLREGDYVVAYFQEPPGTGDYFRVTRFLGDSLFLRSRFIVEDRGIDGQYFGSFIPPLLLFGPYNEVDHPVFRVRFESVTESYANFMRLISEQVQVGSPFDSPPALVIGNIVRQNDSSNFGFGYFRASALTIDTVVYSP